MKQRLIVILLFAGWQCMRGDVIAQTLKNNLTIVYEITINKEKKPGGIEETYNGGTKTLFIAPGKARIRLVSLMRIQSFFFSYDSLLREVQVIKESGANKYRYELSAGDWNDYNAKYENAVCDTLQDSLIIAGYHCRKAILHLHSGEKISLYYTAGIEIGNRFIEPAFLCIPGTVLQYEYASKRGTVTFRASQVKREPISKEVFILPRKGIQARKFTPERIKEEIIETDN